MRACVFPGQGSQFPGMGRDLYLNSDRAKRLFEQANDILGYRLSDVMFDGTHDQLTQTLYAQPSIFLHSVIAAQVTFRPLGFAAVAGHSLGEFSALVVANVLSFEDGLVLVSKRAKAMHKACEGIPSAMAAIIGLDEKALSEVCASAEEVVVIANYNSPSQFVISGSTSGIDYVIKATKEAGAKRALKLPVSGAFHSPLMESAKAELELAIAKASFNEPCCLVFQNCSGQASSDPERIKEALVLQLTSPVLWRQTIENMEEAGVTEFVEVGPSSVLQGLIKQISKSVLVAGIS